MSLPTILITETLDRVCADWLGRHARVVWVKHDDVEALRRQLPGADGLVVRTYTIVDDALLAAAPQVRVVGRAGVGLDNIDVAACRRRGVEVVYTPDANTQAVVEYVLGLMLDHHRPRAAMPDHCSAAGFHELRKTQVGRQLDELTIGIVGFGRIGKRIAQVAHTIGMKVLANDVLSEDELRAALPPRWRDLPCEFVDKAALYARSDVVTLHVDGRQENRGLLDAAAFAAMKEDVLFINAARGMLVDGGALAAWAAAHPGAAAVLDVHDPEPPPGSYPLWGLPNVKLLSHLASRTDRALENMSWVVRDVLAVLGGERPRFPAPPAA
jgi:phosphoglycerate dehydrogenase-like enzyme